MYTFYLLLIKSQTKLSPEDTSHISAMGEVHINPLTVPLVERDIHPPLKSLLAVPMKTYMALSLSKVSLTFLIFFPVAFTSSGRLFPSHGRKEDGSPVC